MTFQQRSKVSNLETAESNLICRVFPSAHNLLTSVLLSGLNSGGTNKKSIGANSSRKSDTSAGCGAYNADYQSDDSILEDRADNSVTKVDQWIVAVIRN